MGDPGQEYTVLVTQTKVTLCMLFTFSITLSLTPRYLFRESTSKLKTIGSIVKLKKYSKYTPKQLKCLETQGKQNDFQGSRGFIKGYSEDRLSDQVLKEEWKKNGSQTFQGRTQAGLQEQNLQRTWDGVCCQTQGSLPSSDGLKIYLKHGKQ